MYNFVFKNSKYDILGLKIKTTQINEYHYDLIVGNKNEIRYLFNINSKVIGIEGNEFYHMSNSSVLVDNDLLYVLTFDKIYVIDIDKIQLKYIIDVDLYSPLDNIYKFNDGILICGEISILYLKGNKIIWDYPSSSWFTNYEVCNAQIKLVDGETEQEIIIDSNGKEINRKQ